MKSACCPDVVDISFINQKRLEDVVVAPDDLFLFDRISRVKTGGSSSIFDANVAARFFEQVLVRVGQQHDRLFRMIDDFVGEIRLIVEDQGDIVFAGDIFRGNDGEFVPGNVACETKCS